MKALMHYTIQESVYEKFNGDECFFSNLTRIKEVENFYFKYRLSQNILLFIVCYTSQSKVSHLVGKIYLKDNNFCYKKVSEEIKSIVLDDLAIENINTYERGIYYKEYTLNNEYLFYNKIINDYSGKVKLKYYEWEELISKNEILHSELIKLIFTKENVLKIASTYSPDIVYSTNIINKKYRDALTEIGFIAKDGINTNNYTLHGDIGEFLMHLLVSDFIKSEGNEKYIYPKLVFKSNPLMSVYGNDGTLYIPSKKEIYFMEAKFYTCLNDAINKAVSSLYKHNQISQENINHKVELFRNIKTNRTNEIVEITDNVKENLILFLMCSDKYKEKDVRECIESNDNFAKLKNIKNVIVFILPILNKDNFLEHFKNVSMKEWVKLNGK